MADKLIRVQAAKEKSVHSGLTLQQQASLKGLLSKGDDITNAITVCDNDDDLMAIIETNAPGISFMFPVLCDLRHQQLMFHCLYILSTLFLPSCSSDACIFTFMF